MTGSQGPPDRVEGGPGLESSNPAPVDRRDTDPASEPGPGGTASVAGALGERGDPTAAFYVQLMRLAFQDSQQTLPPPDVDEDGGEGWPRIPGYEIVQVLGIGGMGIVYKAFQPRLERFVALKMIRAGAGARPQDLVRFEAEARAVAAIDHPNIIKIFEIAEHAGLPYFSLEFLEGGSLDRMIDGKPQPGDECARIVEVLARAMDVAHRRGIIRRDLKPSNVLVAVDGTLKIADFGLVKRLEADSGQTRTDSIIGSPSYMAPEQARGGPPIGPAADQYALGATLYALLTGRPPFRGISALDTLDMVRTKEPVPPSQFLPKVPRDLETICLKCLEKDPARRYPDVAALAEDLRRFRAREPIAARPISGGERLWRWCQRNPRVAGLTGAVAVLLVLAITALTWGVVTVGQRNQQLRETNLRLGQATVDLIAAKGTAEEGERRAVKAAWAAVTQNRNSVGAHRELLELVEDKLRYAPGLQEVREQMLALLTGDLESAVRTMTDRRAEIGWPPEDEELNWRSVAWARQRLGELSLTRNRIAEAMRQFREADAILARQAAASPGDAAGQIYLARSQRQLGFLARDRIADAEAARRHFRRAVEIDRGLVAKEPGNDVYKQELANSLGQLAITEMQLGRVREAHACFQEELATRRAFSPAWAGELEMRRELSGLYEKLAELSPLLGDRAGALRFCQRCTELREQVAAERPGWWPAVNDLVLCYNLAGFLRFPQGGDPRGARAFHGKAVALLSKRVEADPSSLETQGRLAEGLYYEATCALHSGDRAGAGAGYRRCLEIREKLAADPQGKAPRIALMLALARCGDHARAATIARNLVRTPPDDAQIYYYAASGFALAAGAARDHQRASHAVRGSLRSAIGGALDAVLAHVYTASALDCLRRGKQRGWADVVTLETDPDLTPIREDPPFRAWLAEFRRPGASRP